MNAEGASHIGCFIDALVRRDHRGGWRNALIERPDKAAHRLRIFERQLDERYCSLRDDPDLLLDDLARASRVPRVCYFDGSAPPAMLALDEARDQWLGNGSDAIVSFVPGKLAAFLFHEGWGWRCEQP